MRKRKSANIIDVTRAVQAINRAGRHGGITAVARLVGISRPRCKTLIKMAIDESMIYTYTNAYRINNQRDCYSTTEAGAQVIYALEEFKQGMLIDVDEIQELTWKSK